MRDDLFIRKLFTAAVVGCSITLVAMLIRIFMLSV